MFQILCSEQSCVGVDFQCTGSFTQHCMTCRIGSPLDKGCSIIIFFIGNKHTKERESRTKKTKLMWECVFFLLFIMNRSTEGSRVFIGAEELLFSYESRKRESLLCLYYESINRGSKRLIYEYRWDERLKTKDLRHWVRFCCVVYCE